MKTCAFIILLVKSVEAMRCFWESLNYDPILSVGSPASFNISVDGLIKDSEVLGWEVAGNSVAVWVYSTESGFQLQDSVRGGEADVSHFNGKTELTLDYDAVSEYFDMKTVQAFKMDCNYGEKYSIPETLKVSYCTTCETCSIRVDTTELNNVSGTYNQTEYLPCIGQYIGNESVICMKDATWVPIDQCKLKHKGMWITFAVIGIFFYALFALAILFLLLRYFYKHLIERYKKPQAGTERNVSIGSLCRSRIPETDRVVYVKYQGLCCISMNKVIAGYHADHDACINTHDKNTKIEMDVNSCKRDILPGSERKPTSEV